MIQTRIWRKCVTSTPKGRIFPANAEMHNSKPSRCLASIRCLCEVLSPNNAFGSRFRGENSKLSLQQIPTSAPALIEYRTFCSMVRNMPSGDLKLDCPVQGFHSVDYFVSEKEKGSLPSKMVFNAGNLQIHCEYFKSDFRGIFYKSNKVSGLQRMEIHKSLQIPHYYKNIFGLIPKCNIDNKYIATDQWADGVVVEAGQTDMFYNGDMFMWIRQMLAPEYKSTLNCFDRIHFKRFLMEINRIQYAHQQMNKPKYLEEQQCLSGQNDERVECTLNDSDDHPCVFTGRKKRNVNSYLFNKVRNDKKYRKRAFVKRGYWKHKHRLQEKQNRLRFAFAIQGVDLYKLKELKWGEVRKGGSGPWV